MGIDVHQAEISVRSSGVRMGMDRSTASQTLAKVILPIARKLSGADPQ
jgi:hypothetical protein